MSELDEARGPQTGSYDLLRQKYLELQKQADGLAEALDDIVHGEPKTNATTYPHAEKLLNQWNEFKGNE